MQTHRLLQCLADLCQILSLFSMLRLLDGPFKFLDIEREGCIRDRLPLQALPLDRNKMRGVWERLAQLRQQLAQIGASLDLS
jgi:hypothetical protein